MIKIIFGVTDSNSDCERIFPVQYRIGLQNLVKQDIIKNDVPDEVKGRYAYAIHCVGEFYVFSKINIVYGGKSQRISYRSYIIALEKHETNYNVLNEIDTLARQYIDNESIQQTKTLPDSIKGNYNTAKKGIVTVYYYDQNELENYFKINKDYRQYETIYFIDKKLEDTPQDPIKALKNSDKVINISNLNKDYSSEEENTYNKDESFQLTFAEICKSDIVILLFGILLGFGVSIGSLFIYKSLSSGEEFHEGTETENTQLSDLTDSISTKNNQIADLQKSIKNLVDTINILKKKPGIVQPATNNVGGNQGGVNTRSTDTQPSTENKTELQKKIADFLKSECKRMKLDDIVKKITDYQDKVQDNTVKIRLKYFGDFVEALKALPKKDQMMDFCKEASGKLNPDYEYVKFFCFLKDPQFENCTLSASSPLISKVKMRKIGTKTLSEIENYYGYK